MFHNVYFANRVCRRNIEMTPLCKVQMALFGFSGLLKVRGFAGQAMREAPGLHGKDRHFYCVSTVGLVATSLAPPAAS